MVAFNLQNLGSLLNGLLSTILLACAALALGTAIGFVFGVARALRFPIANELICAFVHSVRGTPFLVQLYVLYFVLPPVLLHVTDIAPYKAGLAALALYAGGYTVEIVRGALLAVPSAQIEAGKALGLNLPQRLLLVVLPQALRLMVPPIGSLYVIVIKSTSVLSIIGISELLRSGEVLSMRFPQSMPLVYLIVAALYFCVCFPLLRMVRRLERRVAPLGSN